MEPRASHLTVGALVLLIACSLPALALWSSKSSRLGFVDHYIRFTGTVAGLEVGSNVLLGGIPIGRVTALRVDQQDFSSARVDLSVDGAAPIYSDSKATMQLQGISNVFIDISRGGGAGSRRLGPGEEISARYSALGKLLLTLQDLPAKGDLLIAGANALFTTENAALANRILANLEKLRVQFTAEAPVFDRLSPGITDAIAQFKQTWAEFQLGGENIDKLKAALTAASRSMQNLTGTLGTTMANLGGFVDDNRRSMQDFASNGYPQIAPMISDLHRLGRTLDRLWTEMKQDPARFFLTDRQEGGYVTPPPNVGPHR